jgi:4-hydroxy-4-methyl-2-oxoglutarate aldolase
VEEAEMSSDFRKLERATLSSATLHEAAGGIGALPARIKPMYPEAFASGPAFTVSCSAGDNLVLHHAILLADPGDVLVVLTPAEAEYGYWGEVLSEAAKARGLAGLVIDGGVRDTGELARVGMPVFASYACIRGTSKNPSLHASLQRGIRIGDVTVSPGDRVVADADGVVAIPADEFPLAQERAVQRESKERAYIAAIRRGQTTVDLSGLPRFGAQRQR